jgi:uncharacterized iron-regulated protein
MFFAAAAPAAERLAGDISFEGADVAFLGELHDNPEHHRNQAAWVQQMQPAALVFEMLTPELALKAGADRGDAADLAARLEWEARGWPDFALYHPIFLAAPDAAIFGGALPRAEVRRAMQEGAADVLGGAAPLFGLDRPLSEDELVRRKEGQSAAHCGMLEDAMLPGMVEAQRVRDAAIARAVIAALAETGGPVAVITGNGHARKDWGAPALLARARPDLAMLSIGQFETVQEDPAPYDHWTRAPAPARGDPCAALEAR